MAQAALETRDITQDTPAGTAAAIDREHLARMTFGERSLERELLTLFDRQTVLLLARMRDAEAAVAATLAHTLKGSASGIGAWGVARAAATCEQASGGEGSPAERSLALAELAAAIAEARAEIAGMLGNSH
jgi:HPt (histidine-containing phosphotransfer) domain-containing protein